MSTQPDDLAPPPADDGAPQPSPDAPPADNQPEDNGADSPYADLAQKIGWVPRDQFTGPPEAWKPADQFIIDGRDIQRETASRLKGVEAKLDTLTRTSASIVEQTVNERVAALRTQHAEAVEAGDAEQALKIAQTIDTTIASAKPTNAPPPEAQDFAERNSAWFQKPGHEEATVRAIELANLFASRGYKEPGMQLRLVEQRMQREYPELFKAGMNGTKPPPGVNPPGSRGAPPSNRQKGFADMPKEAQDIARDMMERKVIKSTDDYVRNYFANEAGKA
jgi:hypothetical protein